MEGKAVITLTSGDSGEVAIAIEFTPEIQMDEDAKNPASHHLALRMLQAAIAMSEDPERPAVFSATDADGPSDHAMQTLQSRPRKDKDG